MKLEDMYNTWTFKPLRSVSPTGTPRSQSDGEHAVDFLPNYYQTGIVNRPVGDKTVVQATADDATAGRFTDRAFLRYSALFYSNARVFKTKIVHPYNAQGSYDNARYTTSTGIKNSPGTLYITNL